MATSESRSGLVLDLAEEFLERYRMGERPGLKEYVDRHPDLAGEIREVFPAMAMMENIAIQDDSLVGERTGVAVERPGRVDSRLPAQIGDFRIIREIGHGGMGVVYEAEQVALGRHVALKVLLPQVVRDARQRLRFEREARAAARLHHTNIVPVFGVGEDDGTAYYVMQYIPGLGLDAVIEEIEQLIRAAVAAWRRRRPTTAAERRRGDVSVVDVARSMLTGQFHPAVTGPTSGGPSLESTLADGSPDATDAGTSREVSAAPRPSDPSHHSSSALLPGAGAEGHSGRDGKGEYWRSVARVGVQVAEALSTPTGRASCTGTSSHRTCCSTTEARSGSPISAWPRRTTSRT